MRRISTKHIFNLALKQTAQGLEQTHRLFIQSRRPIEHAHLDMLHINLLLLEYVCSNQCHRFAYSVNRNFKRRLPTQTQ